jgi:hypothetical protein
MSIHVVGVARDLLAFAQALCLEGVASAEPPAAHRFACPPISSHARAERRDGIEFDGGDGSISSTPSKLCSRSSNQATIESSTSSRDIRGVEKRKGNANFSRSPRRSYVKQAATSGGEAGACGGPTSRISAGRSVLQITLTSCLLRERKASLLPLPSACLRPRNSLAGA